VGHWPLMDEEEPTEREVLLAIYSELRTIKWILGTVYVAGLLAVLLVIAEGA
jgi:hypothetical protein